VNRAAVLGVRLLAVLRETHERHLGDAVAEIRGRGLLMGVEYAQPGLAGDVALELMAGGVLVNHSLNAAEVLRLTPPAVLTDADVEFFAAALDEALARVAALRQNRS
jgi:putrescine aminotransferase